MFPGGGELNKAAGTPVPAAFVCAGRMRASALDDAAVAFEDVDARATGSGVDGLVEPVPEGAD